ncbi:hypothetical protein GCM10011418_16260 [Sphingobacterium alkalisoli]|nr:hypothetical protein GCM10011418_16260 [Sphingobacterium alkalisoli]
MLCTYISDYSFDLHKASRIRYANVHISSYTFCYATKLIELEYQKVVAETYQTGIIFLDEEAYLDRDFNTFDNLANTK